jgi:hypothetical protein
VLAVLLELFQFPVVLHLRHILESGSVNALTNEPTAM